MKSSIRILFFISLVAFLSSFNINKNNQNLINLKKSETACDVYLEFKNNTNIVVTEVTMETTSDDENHKNIEVGGSRYSTLIYNSGLAAFTVILPNTHPAGRLELYKGNTIIQCQTVYASPNYAYEVFFTPECGAVYTLVYRKTNSPCP